MRSVFDTLDGVDTTTDDIQALLPDLERLDALMPQLMELMPPQIETMKNMQKMMLLHALHSGEPAGSAGRDERQPVRDG